MNRFYRHFIAVIFMFTFLAACSPIAQNSIIPQALDETKGTAVTGTPNIQLYIEPQDGTTPIVNAINQAQKSVLMEMYILTDTKVIHALENAANRGIEVQVMLESHPVGSSNPSQVFNELQSAGVQVKESSPAFQLTHAKMMVVDDQSAFIMTANMSKSALGDTKYTENREYIAQDENTQDVAQAENIFNADWNRSQVTLNDSNFIVSPINSRSVLLNLIQSAHSSLFIEDEEMADSQIENALISAEQRGIKLEVILPTNDKTDLRNIHLLLSNGISVKGDPQLYMHAKMFLIDNIKAFIGSENVSTTSLDKNREIGLVVTDSQAINQLASTFSQDYNVSSSY